MTITTNPAPARTDVAPAIPTPTAGATRQVRRAGVILSVGTLSWAAAMITVGASPEGSVAITIGDLSAVPFQIGLFALVGAQLRTRATGLSKAARGMLRVEFGLLFLATVWSVLHGAVPAWRDDVWLGILDAFWPLSMLGMFVISVKLAFAGRWRGLGRFWPLVAESWAVVMVPIAVIFQSSAMTGVLGGAHLLIGYCALGLILALKPEVTGATD